MAGLGTTSVDCWWHDVCDSDDGAGGGDDLLRFHGHCSKSALIADGVSPVGLSATEGFSFTSAMSWPFPCSCVPFAGPMLAMDCATGGFATT